MTQAFNWDDLDLGLPGQESEKETMNRLQVIHQDLLASKGLSLKPDKNSPGFMPTPYQARQVSIMACLGLAAKDIALVLNVEEKIVQTYYKKELRVTHNLANMMVARQALQMAMSGRFPDMTKFWLKSRAGWKETSAVELTGKDGAPLGEDGISAKDRLKEVLAKGAAPQNPPKPAPASTPPDQQADTGGV